MRSCAVEQRSRARAALEAVAADPRVVATTLQTPGAEPTNRWSIELTIRADGVPPAVMRALADHDCELREAGPITPDHVRALAVVRR